MIGALAVAIVGGLGGLLAPAVPSRRPGQENAPELHLMENHTGVSGHYNGGQGRGKAARIQREAKKRRIARARAPK